MVAKKHRKSLAEGLRHVFNAPSLTWAKQAATELADGGELAIPKLPSISTSRSRAALPALPFLRNYSGEALHRLKIRSTNGLERLNQEIKRNCRAKP
jgi:transposase-like protein